MRRMRLVLYDSKRQVSRFRDLQDLVRFSYMQGVTLSRVHTRGVTSTLT